MAIRSIRVIHGIAARSEGRGRPRPLTIYHIPVPLSYALGARGDIYNNINDLTLWRGSPFPR
jgi:hypothetical protein